MNKDSKILILGSRGLVGSSIVRLLKEREFLNVLTPTREQLNLLSQLEVKKFISKHRPDVIIDAAAKVGGIHANNTYRADFVMQNLSIQNNLFEAALAEEVPTFLFLGSSCIYPKNSEQPIKEEYLLTSPLEPTNEPYAIAKIAGLKTAESIRKQYDLNYFSIMPTNLYGPNDNFHPKNSHVIPALIQRMDKTIKDGKSTFEVWGTGKPRREFLFVDDLADACLFLLSSESEKPDWLNVGTGEDVSIAELATTIGNIMGFKGEITFNTDYPDGTYRKLLDVSKLKELGWKANTSLHDGLKKTIEYYLNNENIRSY